MSKRGGEDQITKDNYDDDANDGSSETMGTFKKASNDEISKRIGGGDAPKAPSAFASFGTPSTTQSGFGGPAVNFSSTSSFTGFGDKPTPSTFTGFGDKPALSTSTGFGDKPALSTSTGFGDKPASSFSGFGDKPSLTASSGFGDKPVSSFAGFSDKPALSTSSGFGDKPALSTSTGFGDKPASAFTGFGDKPALAFTGFGDKSTPSLTSFGDKPAATGFGDKPAAIGFGDKPAPTLSASTGFSFKSSAPSILDQAKPSPFTSFGDKPALSSTPNPFSDKPALSSLPNPFGDKTSVPSFTGFGDKATTTPAFTGFAKGSDSGSSTFKALPDTRTTTASTTTTTTTTLNGNGKTPKPFMFKPATTPSSLPSTSDKTKLRTELHALNKNFIDKLQGAMDKERTVNLAQVFNKYTESRLKIKRLHSGSVPTVPSSAPLGFGGVGPKSDAPFALFTGRSLDTDKPEGISTGRKLSEDDEDEYNRDAEDWEDQQEFEGHYNEGIEDEYDENDENHDEEDERDDEIEEADEEPKAKPFGGFNFGVADAAKPKPAAFNFGVNFPSSTTATSTTTAATTTTASSGFGGAFSSAPFGASTGGAFGNLASKGSDSAAKTLTPSWTFGQVSSSGATSLGTSAPTSTPSLFSTPANPFSSASSITPAPFAPAKPFSFNIPGASTTTATTTPFSGFQVPAKAPTSSNEAESDKMPDDTKSELVDDRVGEEDEKTVFEVKAKLYAVEGGENKDKGVGQFRVNENGETKKRRMIMRIAGTGQLVLNSWVIQKMPPKREKNIVTLFAIEEGKPKRFMLRVKEESSATELVKELELGQLDE
ncbi:hypothetical protein BG003_005875 [Podila horticola]|nr:hypothetical protein BG003_005875 [Podila horticola]